MLLGHWSERYHDPCYDVSIQGTQSFDLLVKLQISYRQSHSKFAFEPLSVIVWESVPEVKNVGQPILMKLGPEVGHIYWDIPKAKLVLFSDF